MVHKLLIVLTFLDINGSLLQKFIPGSIIIISTFRPYAVKFLIHCKCYMCSCLFPSALVSYSAPSTVKVRAGYSGYLLLKIIIMQAYLNGRLRSTENTSYMWASPPTLSDGCQPYRRHNRHLLNSNLHQ